MASETCTRTLLCLFVIALVATNQANAALSMEQLEKTAATVRNTCVSKINANMDVVLGMQKGEFPDDPTLKCYTHCVLKTMRGIKGGRIDGPMMIKQVDLMMPADTAAFMRDTITVCSAEPPAGDDCQTSYNYVKCSYNHDPAHFFFP